MNAAQYEAALSRPYWSSKVTGIKGEGWIITHYHDDPIDLLYVIRDVAEDVGDLPVCITFTFHQPLRGKGA